MGFSDLGCYGGEIRTPNLDGLAARRPALHAVLQHGPLLPDARRLLTGLYPHQAGIGHMVERPRHCPATAATSTTAASPSPRCCSRPATAPTWSGKWHVTPGRRTPSTTGRCSAASTATTASSTAPAATYDPADADARQRRRSDARRPGLLLHRRHQPTTPSSFIERARAASTSRSSSTSPSPRRTGRCTRCRRTSRKYQRQVRRAAGTRCAPSGTARMIELGMIDKRWPLTPRDPSVPAWDDAPNKDWQAAPHGGLRRADRPHGPGHRPDPRRSCKRDGPARQHADPVPRGQRRLRRGDRPRPARHIPPKTRDGRPVRSATTRRHARPRRHLSELRHAWANASNTPFRLYKHWVHEGGIATPLIAHWPAGIKQPARSPTQPGHLIDIMATCVDVAGAEYPEEFEGNAITPLEGKSLLPVFEGKTRAGHEAIFWEHEGNRAVRQGKWKLVSRYPGRLGTVRPGGRPHRDARPGGEPAGKGAGNGGEVRRLGAARQRGAVAGSARQTKAGLRWQSREGCSQARRWRPRRPRRSSASG